MKQLLSRLFTKPEVCAQLIAVSFFINILTLAAPFFFILVFNRYLTGGVDGTLITLTIGMLMAIVIQYAFRSIRTRLAGEVGLQPEESVTKTVLDVLGKTRMQVFSQVKKAALIRAVSSVHTLQGAYSAPNVNSVLDMPYSFLFILVIFLLNFQLGLVALSGALFTMASSWVTMHGASESMKVLQHEASENQALVNAAVNEPETMRAFNGMAWYTSPWIQQMKAMAVLRKFSAHNEDVSQARLMAIGLISRTFIIAFGARQVLLGELTIGALIGISILSSIPLTILARFVRTWSQLQRAEDAERILGQFLKMPMERLSGSALKKYSGGLSIKGVSFHYPGDKNPVFSGLTLHVAAGSFTGITGFNGSGKSTVAKTLAGLLEPSKGQVLIDGLDLSQVSIEWWRKQIVYLPQEPGFFPGSIKKNILAANPDLKNDQFNDILHVTGLRRFLDLHPKGLELEIDETGRPLPLGIRRRIALARAMTTSGQLVILDEPAEGLDVEGWKMVNSCIRKFRQQNKTLVIFTSDPRLLVSTEIIIDLGTKPEPTLVKGTGPGSAEGGAIER